MDDRWGADIDTELTGNGQFVAYLVLTPPSELGEPIRVPIEGEYEYDSRRNLANWPSLTGFILG